MSKSTVSSYDESLLELQQIVADIENETTGVDELSKKIKRATELLHFCKHKLRSVAEDVQESLEKLD